MTGLLIAVAMLFSVSLFAHAEPVVAAVAGNVRITLYDEPCVLTDAVVNLPNRATWDEDGKHYEGCFGFAPGDVVMAYFDDKTVAVVPKSAFRVVTSA